MKQIVELVRKDSAEKWKGIIETDGVEILHAEMVKYSKIIMDLGRMESFRIEDFELFLECIEQRHAVAVLAGWIKQFGVEATLDTLAYSRARMLRALENSGNERSEKEKSNAGAEARYNKWRRAEAKAEKERRDHEAEMRSIFGGFGRGRGRKK